MKSLVKSLKRLNVRRRNRFEEFVTSFTDFNCTVIDKSSFLFMYDEIFEKEIYNFPCKSERPFIIDCGANIGLATIYLKKKFPNAEIIAFEPDPKIFTVLEKNIKSSNTSESVTCIQACLTKTEGNVTFYSDGADGGSMSTPKNDSTSINVRALRLKNFIDKPVDFLKIDIEGAEHEVLVDTIDKLHLVKNIFVEYHSFTDSEQKFDDILKILRLTGFRYYIEHIGIRSEKPYFSRNSDHNMDLQINIYGYRI